MTLPEQFTRILEKAREQELLPFLKTLSPEQRTALSPHLRSLAKEYLASELVISNGSMHYKTKATPVQTKMLQLSAFVCCSRGDYEKIDPWGSVVDSETLRPVQEWYCPDWLNGYINQRAERDFVPYHWTYEWIMELAEKRLVCPSRALVTKLLPQLIYETASHRNQWQYKPENLLKRDITLKEHLWYFFEAPSTVHNSERYRYISGLANGEEAGWILALKAYASEGKIDRTRLLQESLLATTRNFSKTLSGWFAELFLQLAPSPEELLALQAELFIVFNSPHSKPVNTALRCVKSITDLEGFRAEEFLENVPLLLVLETKSIVATTLQILERVAKRFPEKGEAVCLAACQALIHRDEAIQLKAARLIVQYGKPGSLSLGEALAPYSDSLLSRTRNQLSHFLPQIPVGLEASAPLLAPQPNCRIAEEKAMEPVRTFEDLLYLASQAFDNNESHHLDQLPAALITHQAQIRGSNIAKLEPAFQRAYKLLMEGGQGNSGMLDQLLATFFVNYAMLLLERFPQETQSLRSLHERYATKDQAFKAQYTHYTPRIGSLTGWQTYNKETYYEPFKQLLIETLDKLRVQETLPLLSTPTHLPGWIAPTVFIERLLHYQAAEAEPHDLDLQIALSRLVLEGRTEALKAASQLKGEFRNLIVFLFKVGNVPLGPFTRSNAWVMAALIKNPASCQKMLEELEYEKLPLQFLTGQLPWRVKEETYSYDQYDYQKRRYFKAHRTHRVLRVELPARKQQNGFQLFLAKLLPSKKVEQPLLYELLSLTGQYFSVVASDMQRLMLLVPNHPEPVLAQLLHTCLKHPIFSGESEKRGVAQALQVLRDIWQPLGKIAHAFVATALVSSDKTVRALAAEIWISGVVQSTIDSEWMGESIGKLAREEFVPLKRLIDLLTHDLFRISDRHNRELEEMLTSLLLQLPKQPVKNMKKLLEAYLEVLTANGSYLEEEKLLCQLTVWKTSAGLSKVIQALEHRPALEAVA